MSPGRADDFRTGRLRKASADQWHPVGCVQAQQHKHGAMTDQSP